MPLVNAKCTNCGANLEVDSSKDAAICQYCGSAFIVEKAINNYNITNHNNINAEVVNIYGGNSADFVIRAGVLEKYNGASTSVVIPNSVTIIGDSAFSDCRGLTSVTIPNSVTSIGNSAFRSCSSLTSVTVDANNKYYSSVDGVLFNKDKTKLIQYPRGNARTSYTIPNSVTSIGDYAFCSCDSLTSVTIGNSVTSIGYLAFDSCTSLTSVTIPNSVTSIGDSAFRNCTSLTSVTIPNSVTSMGNAAFWQCDSLTSVTIGNSVTSIGNAAFDGCTSLTSVTIPDSVTSIGNSAFAHCDSLTSVTIPNSVTSIGYNSFKDCSSLAKVTLPQGMKYDEIERAFHYTHWWERKKRGVCTYCGGTFKGIFSQKCSKCGMPKNY